MRVTPDDANLKEDGRMVLELDSPDHAIVRHDARKAVRAVQPVRSLCGLPTVAIAPGIAALVVQRKVASFFRSTGLTGIWTIRVSDGGALHVVR